MSLGSGFVFENAILNFIGKAFKRQQGFASETPIGSFHFRMVAFFDTVLPAPFAPHGIGR
jgi:hypothetical protein